ncbi:hypothetical protein HNQ71_003332 [Mesorhizobium sangaii]|uniref:ATP-dependent DNA ligase family profile domain-containing protein n=1 Tax=Mesorhizobium sangaii TaxID=505389 RepID=A0A841PD46_9HYPH|nr:hypothetical protein [Mesorhizobium sangaii]MBB6410658.1 hypothetical protein [Mesorhizobium sangaii]
MRLKFIPPLMPTPVERPPEGDRWIHEVKFDGYRSQLIIDDEGARIYLIGPRSPQRDAGFSGRGRDDPTSPVTTYVVSVFEKEALRQLNMSNLNAA